MRIILFALALASSCLALPAPQENKGLDNLITNVFGPPPSNGTMTVVPSDKVDSLISTVFGGSQNTTTSRTILGTQNQQKVQTENCECVPYYQCRNGTILENGIGLIDIRSNFDTEFRPFNETGFGKCENYLDVCCTPPDRVQPEEVTTQRPVQRIGCGQRHLDGVGFKITGAMDNEAEFGEFPWMVAVLKKETIGGQNEKLNVYQCGGSLIHRQAVLTAAHCVQGKRPSELRIRAGEWDTQTKNEILPHQDRAVQNVIIHENFNPDTVYYDFAILILSEPVEYAENIDIVCLPEQNAVFDGSRCFASGWGKDIFGKEGHYQVILKKVDLPVVPRDTCQQSLRNTRLGKYFILHDTFICAGGEPGKDTCKGDGGSPLVCSSKNDPSRYQQAGIVAWGIGCGQDGTPGVYANVASVRDWIDEKMAFNNLDNTVYNI